MNILIISKYASPPKYTKISSRLFYLAKEMINIGHKVCIITSDSNHLANFPSSNNFSNFEIDEGVPFFWLKTYKYDKTASIGRVFSWLDFEIKLFFFNKRKIEKPDVIIVSSLSILSIVNGFFLKKKYKSKLVFEIRDIWPLTMTEEGGFSKFHPLVLFIALIEKFGYYVSDLIVGTMPKLDIHVKNILGYEKPFFCSPLGFTEDNYLNQNGGIDKLIHYFPKNKVIIGYAGSLGITNALETFISTIKLMNSISNIHFMIVGSGDLKEKYVEQLSECTNVTILDRIEQKEVKFFLEKCDIAYLSTKDSKVWDYGQSMNKIVEYMLCGKPIIASFSGYPSMINESECGVFIKHPDSNLLKSVFLKFANMPSDKRIKIGEQGKNWILENRNYKKLAEEYVYRLTELKKF